MRVSLVPASRTCFAAVPASLTAALLSHGSSHVVLRLETDDWHRGQRSELLVSWEGEVSAPTAAGEEVLELGSGVWSALRPESVVTVERVETPPDIGVLCVEPLSSDDWEVLELNAGHLEEHILKQLFVLSVGQTFPLHVYGKHAASLVVRSIDCGQCGVLRPDTSFVVQPKPRKAKRSAVAASAASSAVQPVTLRVLPLSGAAKDGFVEAACADWSEGTIVTIANPHPPLRKAEEGSAALSRLVARVQRDGSVPRGCVRLSGEAMLALQVLPFAKVIIAPCLQSPEAGLKVFELVVLSRKKTDIAPLWDALMSHSATRVFANGSLIELAPGLLCRLVLKDVQREYVLGESLKNTQKTLSYAPQPLSLEAVRPLSPRVAQLVGAEEAVKKLRSHVLFFAQHPRKLGKLAVVSGGIGSGKSAVVRAVCESVEHLYTEIVDCESLVTEKLSSVRQLLTDAVLRCQGNFPGCLVLENLHLLCPENDEASLRPQQLSEALGNLLRSAALVAIATVPNVELLHPCVRQLAISGTTVAMESLTREQRRELALRVAMELQLHEAANEAVLEYVADATDGFCPGDIRSLLQRVPRNDFSEKSVAEAKKLSTPSNLLGIKLHKSRVTFAQIGGLAAAKTTLRETLGYPKLHAKLLKNSPIKLPTGVLLYGPPGSGKTMLASAAAQEFGLNAICVSGPELLSKYIGQSEQSVRELFHRAKQCKPSVIVFDEFDSIAPKRGHDSTGVTDRVVNQLLTQLDGVESRQGVFVVAVSSRPDLIDPALLRPGRLDKLVFVGLPDAAERREILQLVSSSMHLAPDVDLEAIAGRAVNFSGADLQALLYNAQLGAVHESLDMDAAALPAASENEAGSNTSVVVVRADQGPLDAAKRAQVEALFASTPSSASRTESRAALAGVGARKMVVKGEHVAKALGELRPSISDADRRKFEGIYGQFQQSQRGADFKAGLDDNGPKQTLM